MRQEGTAGVNFGELVTDGGADGVDDLVFVEEVHFALRGMDVDVHAVRVDVEAQIGEGVTTFGKEGGVGLIDCFLDRGGFDGAVVDEEKEHSLFDVVIRVAGPA